jgi:hypothetical protein
MSQTPPLARPGGMKRAISILLAITMGGNAVVMLAAGPWWYGAVPGVTETGPFNQHFVKDIGAAYLVVGVAFAWLAARPSATAIGAAQAAAAFLALHALIHVGEAIGNPMGLAHLARDSRGVLLPALLAIWIAWPSQPKMELSHA